MVRLGDVGPIVTGNTPPTNVMEYYENSDIPFYKPNDLKETDIINLGAASNYIDYRAKSKLRILPKGSVLVTCIGTIGKVGVTDLTESTTNQQINAIIPNKSLCHSKYLAYTIFSLQQYLQDKANAPVVPIINKKDFSNIQIPLPPLDVQERIADELAKIAGLIAKRKLQITKLDLLVKAKFVEMFGDPVVNPMGWEEKNIHSFCSEILGGGTPSKSKLQYYEGAIPWVTPKDMKSSLIFDSIDHITEEAIQNSSAKLIRANSILMVIRSGILKHTLPVAINIIPVTINQDMKAYIPNESTNPLFLLYSFKFWEKKLLSNVRVVTADNIEFSVIRNLVTICPSLPLQNQFADYVAKVEDAKENMQNGLKQLEVLYKERMQEYFEESPLRP